MKNLLLTITVSLFSLSLFSQGCLPEGIKFTTQEQIDRFKINYPNCTYIKGDVEFNGEDITNLDSLSILTSIQGYLRVNDNNSLKNLNGLYNLVSIGEELQIEDNDSLGSLEGLDNLETISGDLWIRYNQALIDITSLDNLDPNTIQDINIYRNITLSNCVVQTLCEYLANPIGTVKIYSNALGCNNWKRRSN